MVIQSSMGAHQLDVRQGDRNTLPYYNGILLNSLLADADLLNGLVTAGRVMSVTTTGRLAVGIAATASTTAAPVPFYAWSGYDLNNYPDVYRPRGMPGVGTLPTGGIGGPGSPGFYGIPVTADGEPLAGVFATIAVNAAAELSTTEFDTAATYTPGQLLTCVAASATAAQLLNRGKLRPTAAGTDVIVARVAPAGKFTNAAGYSCLAFYPQYTPGSTVPTALT